MTILKSGSPADLRKFIDKQLSITLNGNRNVVGNLRGYDNFMNLVLENTTEILETTERSIGTTVIRGNSVIMWECIDKVKM